jgi:streptogramin lyase
MKERGGRAGAVAVAALVLSGALLCLALAEVAAAAAPSKAAVTLYRLPRVPPTGGTGPLAIDQQGNVWFEETYEKAPEEPGEPVHFPGQIVRMNRQGDITVATQLRPSGLTAAPDGGIWFTGFRSIGRIAPGGLVSTFPLPDGENEAGKVVFKDGPIVVGADGNVWFSGARGIRNEDGGAVGDQPIIGRLTPTGELAEFDLPREGGHPIRLAAGPDGNVWFTEAFGQRVARIAPSGQIQGFPLSPSSRPYDIAAGFDGALWFTEEKGDFPVLARITTAGAIPNSRSEAWRIRSRDRSRRGRTGASGSSPKRGQWDGSTPRRAGSRRWRFPVGPPKSSSSARKAASGTRPPLSRPACLETASAGPVATTSRA